MNAKRKTVAKLDNNYHQFKAFIQSLGAEPPDKLVTGLSKNAIGDHAYYVYPASPAQAAAFYDGERLHFYKKTALPAKDIPSIYHGAFNPVQVDMESRLKELVNCYREQYKLHRAMMYKAVSLREYHQSKVDHYHGLSINLAFEMTSDIEDARKINNKLGELNANNGGGNYAT